MNTHSSKEKIELCTNAQPRICKTFMENFDEVNVKMFNYNLPFSFKLTFFMNFGTPVISKKKHVNQLPPALSFR